VEKAINKFGGKRSQSKMVWLRLRRNKLAMFGLIMLTVMALIAVFAGAIVDYQTDVVKQNIQNRFQKPSREHIFGTDLYGRDVFGRIIYGARTSLTVGIATVMVSLIAGTAVGSIAGYFGGKVDMFLMRIMDIFLAIPSLVLAIAVVGALGTKITNLMIALSIARAPHFARIVRATILPIKEQEYIEAARACGTSSFRIITRHIIPNAFGPIIVQATMQIGTAILNISSMSFIGLGIQPPAPEWGSMLSEAREYMRYYPYLVIAPGVSIILAVFSFNRLGDGLRDALDPRLRN
jgi:peptide/nickel transport system permease protein